MLPTSKNLGESFETIGWEVLKRRQPLLKNYSVSRMAPFQILLQLGYQFLPGRLFAGTTKILPFQVSQELLDSGSLQLPIDGYRENIETEDFPIR